MTCPKIGFLCDSLPLGDCLTCPRAASTEDFLSGQVRDGWGWSPNLGIRLLALV